MHTLLGRYDAVYGDASERHHGLAALAGSPLSLRERCLRRTLGTMNGSVDARRGLVVVLLAVVLGIALIAVIADDEGPPTANADVTTTTSLTSTTIRNSTATSTTAASGATTTTTAAGVTTTTKAGATRPDVKLGSKGADVTYLQQRLAALGYNPGSADGTFGPSTQTALVAFQTAKGLTADGVAGPATWAALG